MSSKLLCVYCSSSDRLDPKYYAAATEIGTEMAKHGWGLVYGGGRTGLMGSVARAVKTAGGRVVGIIPDFMKAKELAFTEADELVTVVTMRERKLLMETRADAFLTLPGGWGTLEEIMEILTLRQLDVLRKPCVIYNQDGFYDGLMAVFRQMVAEKFNKPSNLDLFTLANRIDDIFPAIEERPVLAEVKWYDTK